MHYQGENSTQSRAKFWTRHRQRTFVNRGTSGKGIRDFIQDRDRIKFFNKKINRLLHRREAVMKALRKLHILCEKKFWNGKTVANMKSMNQSWDLRDLPSMMDYRIVTLMYYRFNLFLLCVQSYQDIFSLRKTCNYFFQTFLVEKVAGKQVIINRSLRRVVTFKAWFVPQEKLQKKHNNVVNPACNIRNRSTHRNFMFQFIVHKIYAKKCA